MAQMKLGWTNIEYAVNKDGSRGRSWNFYRGCLHKPMRVCSVEHCWAESMSKRQKLDFHKPHLVPELLLAPLSVRKPSTILVNFMGDLFGDWVDPNQDIHFNLFDGREAVDKLQELIFKVIQSRPEHTFLFLTKAPHNLQKWGWFPDNAWVGVSVCNQRMLDKALIYLSDVEAKHKWLSFEPLLEEIIVKPIDLEDIGWVIIGGQSNPIKYPEIDYVKAIVEVAEMAGAKVWLKKNLNPLFAETTTIKDKWVFSKTNFMRGELYRQERPQ